MAEQPTHEFSKLAEQLVSELRRVPFDEPARSKKRPTQTIAAVVEALMDKHQIGRDSPEQTIRDNWRELVGATAAAYSHPARLERNLLTVLAPHAVVRNELFMHREIIVERIRKLRGCGEIKALNLRAG